MNDHDRDALIALVCDAQGVILQVARDDFGIAAARTPGQSLTALVDNDSVEKARAFLAALQTQGIAFDWALNVSLGGQLKRLYFAGGRREAGLLLLGTASRAGATHLYEALNKGHTHSLAARLLAQIRRAYTRVEQDEGLYHELSRLNNELVTLQRALTQQNRELHAQREHFRVTLACMGEGVLVTDGQGCVTFLNPVAQTLTGWQQEEAAGQALEQVLRLRNEETRSPVEALVATVERAGVGSALAPQTMLLAKGGGEIPIDGSAAPIKDADGQLLGVVIVFRDITARKAAEADREQLLAEVQRVNAELRQFASVVSHDLNEPLRTIRGFVNLLARQTAGNLGAEAQESMAFVTDAAQRMQQLLADLLAYTRAGHKPKWTAVNCEAVLARVLQDVQFRIEEAGAAVTHEPLPTVQGDATRLAQVFQNLIGNALKFRRPEAPPRLHVSASREEGHWRFAVRDQGIGIDPKHADRIFQVFERLHPRREYPGTGMGLAICKKIVEQHGGRMWVESQPGAGATFYFTISDTKVRDAR